MAISKVDQRTALRWEALRQDLSIGLHTVTEINQSIRYADTKAGALAAVQALAVTVLANRRGGGAADLVPTVLFALGLVLVLVSSALLVIGQFPRLSSRAASSRVAFPALAAMPPGRTLTAPTLAAQHEEVWQQASDLATIAMAKYRWLHRATIGTFLALVTVLLCLGLTV